MWFTVKELDQYRINKGDLLVSEGGEVGRTAIWNEEIDECYIQNSVHKVTMRNEHHSRFFLHLLGIYGKIGHFNSVVNRVSIAHLTKEKLQDIYFVHPSLPEQRTIAEYLDRKTEQIDTLIDKKRRQIDSYSQYRTALIANVVTGKIDIRGDT